MNASLKSGQLKKLLDYSPQLLFVHDRAGAVHYANMAARKLLDLGTNDFSETNLLNVIPKVEGDKLRKHLREIEQSPAPLSFELKFCRGDNLSAEVQFTSMWDAEEELFYCIGFAVQDKSSSTANEEILQRLNISLERRARELAASNEELERFAYVASHDLQEPLRMVTSFLQLLEKKYRDKLDTKGHEYIAYAVDGAERMKKLILDLLQYSRVNSSKLNKEDVDLNAVVKEVQHLYKNLLQETKGTVNAKELPIVKANKTQMVQLFQNFVGNALKYRSAAPPLIEILYREEDNLYEFSVADNGIGIAEKFYDKIFIIFQRLHHRDKYGGTGIGLAVCKKIVDRYGGKIWVNSKEGQGSTFYFTLPKSK